MNALMLCVGGVILGIVIGMKLSEWASKSWRTSAQNTLDGLQRAYQDGVISFETANRICDGWKP